MAWEAAQQQKQAAQSAQQQLPSATSAGATAAAGAAAPLVAGAAAPAGPCWLCVSNLHKDLGEAELQQLFAPFGQLLTVQLVRDPAAANASTGTAYVQFAKLDDAARAMAHWHGRKLVESTLSVTADAPPSVTAGMPLGAPLLPGALLPGGVPLAVPLPGAVPAVAAAAAPAAEPPAPLVVPGELDEDAEGGGLKINAQGRVALMTKLAGGAGLPPPPALVTPAGVPVVPGAAAAAPVAAVAPALAVDPQLMLAQGVLGPGSPIPTPCLMLKNMFDPATAGDGAAASELAAEVEADVRDECSRFGEVVHCWVDAKGKVSAVVVCFWHVGAPCLCPSLCCLSSSCLRACAGGTYTASMQGHNEISLCCTTVSAIVQYSRPRTTAVQVPTLTRPILLPRLVCRRALCTCACPPRRLRRRRTGRCTAGGTAGGRSWPSTNSCRSTTRTSSWPPSRQWWSPQHQAPSLQKPVELSMDGCVLSPVRPLHPTPSTLAGRTTVVKGAFYTCTTAGDVDQSRSGRACTRGCCECMNPSTTV